MQIIKPPKYCHIYKDSQNRINGIRIAEDLEDFQKVIAIRSVVYIGEQNCPYDEEFDGNDMMSKHLLAFHKGEPAGTLRIREYADHVKLERLAVIARLRNSTTAFKLVHAGIEFARKKGWTTIYGHVQEGREKFWAHFGAKPLPNREEFSFSGYSYTEQTIKLKPHPDPINLNSSPYQLIAPEGKWHMKGILEKSAAMKRRKEP